MAIASVTHTCQSAGEQAAASESAFATVPIVVTAASSVHLIVAFRTSIYSNNSTDPYTLMSSGLSVFRFGQVSIPLVSVYVHIPPNPELLSQIAFYYSLRNWLAIKHRFSVRYFLSSVIRGNLLCASRFPLICPAMPIAGRSFPRMSAAASPVRQLVLRCVRFETLVIILHLVASPWLPPHFRSLFEVQPCLVGVS